MVDENQEEYEAYLGRQGFELENHLGRGHSGNVWLARQPNLHDRPVAVKFCDTFDARKNPKVRKRFRRAVELLSRCQHPRIPYVITRGVVEGPEVPYVVMEYIDGENLNSVCEWEGPFKPKRAVELMLPVVDALASVHRHQVVHRDVTPHNIMITDEQGPMLIDFSIGADNRSVGEGPTGTGERLGTQYAAPEQHDDAKSIDACADVYSSGLVLFKLMTGHHEFSRETGVRFEIPDELLDVLATTTAHEPSSRYADGSALYDALEPFAEGADFIWRDTVELAVCPNVECWEWDSWEGGIWTQEYFQETSARYCTSCGEELLRRCPGCHGEITRDNFCGGCGIEWLGEPSCEECGTVLSRREWHENRTREDDQCNDCRSGSRSSEDSFEDVPF